MHRIGGSPRESPPSLAGRSLLLLALLGTEVPIWLEDKLHSSGKRLACSLLAVSLL